MARPERNTVDYFPFICDDGKKMFYIEETYGNDGFATFLKILRELAKTEYHYLDLSKNTTLMFLSAKCKVSKETLKSIITDLAELDKFDSDLWHESEVIWCQDFIDSIQDAYKKRNNQCITLQGLLLLLTSLGVTLPIKYQTKAPVKPQRKEKDSKVEKNKENNDVDFEDEKPEIDQEKKENLIEKLIEDFNFTEMRFDHKKRLVFQFVTNLANMSLMDDFIEQFLDYKKFKEISGEKTHSFDSFIGKWDKDEQQFTGGAWNAQNWAQRIEQLKQSAAGKSKTEQIIDDFKNVTYNPH